MSSIPALWWHPRRVTLSRYADRGLDASAMRSVSRHLVACRKCQSEVDRVRRLGELARADTAPRATLAMFERIIARRETGERVILPLADRAPASARWQWNTVAAAAVVVIAISAALLLSRTATAAGGDGDVAFSPVNPRPGEQVDAVYRPSERFAGDSVLMLRARFAIASRDVPTGYAPTPPTRFVMKRALDGSFHARFTFPLKVAYSAFAVEDPDALRIDSHGGALWELLTGDANGRPTFDALRTAASERIGWDARRSAARALVAAFPDSISAWATLTFTSTAAQGETDTTLLAASRRALMRFDDVARRSENVNASTISSLQSLSYTLHDSARLSYWQTYAVRNAPRSGVGALLRAVQIVRSGFRDSLSRVRTLPALEKLWQEVGAVDPSFTTFGLQGAEHAGDPAAIARWGRRYRDMMHDTPESRQWVGGELVKYAASRQDGLAMLRSLLVPVDVVTDPRRRLRQSAPDREHELDEQCASALQLIGEGLLADGQQAGALDTLRLAGRTGWNVQRFRDIALAALGAGDSTDAAQMLALVAADPETPLAFADSARARLGTYASGVAWKGMISQAQATMRERILATAARTPLYGDRVNLRLATGEARTFAQLTAGHVTVVAFGADLEHKGSPVNLAAMQSLASSLATQGARVVVIALHPWRPGMLDSLRVRHAPIAVVFDDHREAERAFDAYGFPIFCVVDASGTIRFRYSQLSELRAQVATLTHEAQVATAR